MIAHGREEHRMQMFLLAAGSRAAGDEEAVEAGWLRGVAWGKQPG